jgi:hypothetical protein
MILVGTWLVIQQLSISALENVNRMLRSHIASASLATPDEAASPAQTAAPDRIARHMEPLDWKNLVGPLAEMQRSGGIGDMRVIVHLQQRLQMMTQEEIIAALDEIAALELPAPARVMLERILLLPLIQKNPGLALTRFIDRLADHDGMLVGQLADALREWAKQDAGLAGAWLDQQFAAGKFDTKALDGRSPPRMLFEGSLIGVLLASNPAAAARRAGALPEDQRGDVLGTYALNSIKQENLAALAKLVRSKIPAHDQTRVFALQTTQWVAQGGYAQVADCLTRIKATPAERLACVEQAVASTILPNDKPVTREDLDTMREWVGTQMPNAIDNITGKALCAAAMMGTRKLDLAAAADLAVHYSQANGNDDVLVALVESWAVRSNKEQARSLAGKIADEARRAEILKRLE